MYTTGERGARLRYVVRRTRWNTIGAGKGFADETSVFRALDSQQGREGAGNSGGRETIAFAKDDFMGHEAAISSELSPFRILLATHRSDERDSMAGALSAGAEGRLGRFADEKLTIKCQVNKASSISERLECQANDVRPIFLDLGR
ncbi:hypothetical protein KM043_004304 [Ampulex compressa]|nr:hypothetical protein KM043_004304 [Ampulex compressa]